MRERPAALRRRGWICGAPEDYDREYCVDLAQLSAFLRETQPEVAEALDLGAGRPDAAQVPGPPAGRDHASAAPSTCCATGIKHGPHHLDLFYGTPSPGNVKAAERYAANRFSVTRQLRYSRDETQRALDLGLFINGLPVATFELKNSLTKQTVEDAVEQYKRDRDPREKLFEFGRCVVHFAVDDHEVRFCTHLKGKASWFLPFNLGWNDGAGNPPNPNGLKTDYLWKRILTRDGLTDILENYAQVVETKDEKTGKKKAVQIWPRFHQLDVVRKLLADARANGAGRRYLIQHSAGSGKSNSIAWLAHQLIGLKKDDAAVFDSIIVVTDRRILDQQIRDTIKQFAQVGATVGHAEHSGDLRKFIAERQEDHHLHGAEVPVHPRRDRQRAPRAALRHHHRRGALEPGRQDLGGGRDGALDGRGRGGRRDARGQDQPADGGQEAAAQRQLLRLHRHAQEQDAGDLRRARAAGRTATVKHRPFHSYTMKQAIQEGFILDVLEHYTPVESYYKLVKKVEGDPEFDTKRAKKKLRRYVESHDHAIRLKAEIMVDHFHEQVLALNKIGGEARAMVVTSGIERAIQYFHAIRDYLERAQEPATRPSSPSRASTSTAGRRSPRRRSTAFRRARSPTRSRRTRTAS